MEARLLPKVKPGLVASSSNFQGRLSGGGAVKLVLVERHEGVDPTIVRAAPSRSSILVVPSRIVNEPARIHRCFYTRSRYGLEVDSKSTTPLCPEIRQIGDPVELE